MTHDVFISYCRSTARQQAQALGENLAKEGVSVFLDLEEIPAGTPFPARIADGLLSSRTVVVFADAAYFQRIWCVYEFRVIVAGYYAGKDQSLGHVMVALSSEGDAGTVVSHLPPPLAQGAWPQPHDTAKLAALVKERLTENQVTVGQRLEGVDDDAVRSLRSGALVPAPSAPPPRLIAPASMPESLKEHFLGRTDVLWRIFAELEIRGAGQAPRSCLLQGGGGMGKSQLAAEYVMRYGGEHYPDGIVWIDASGNGDDLAGQYQHVLERFGRTAEPGSSLDTLAAELAELIQPMAASQRLLWVVDNVPEPVPGTPAQRISRWCPVKPFVSLLCTSRRGVGDMDATIVLRELSVSAAIDLVSQPPVKRPWLTDMEWQEVVQWIGCWPLGLRILHTDLGDGFVTARSLLAQSRKEEPAQALDSAMDSLRSEVEEGYLRGVAEVFRGSHAALRGQPEAFLLAHAMARLARAPLEESLLEGLVSGPAIGILARRSLIQATESTAAVRGWVMHRIVASYLRSVSDDPKQEFIALSRWLRDLFSSDRPWSELGTVVRHARMAAQRFSGWLAVSGDDGGFQAATELGVALATTRLVEDAARGVRFTGAEFCDAIGVGDTLAAELNRLYDGGDAMARAAVVRVSSGLHRNAEAALLLARAFGDADPAVRWLAFTQSGFSQRGDLLAIPLLDALMGEPAGEGLRNATLYLSPFLSSSSPDLLREILSRLAWYLPDVDLDHCIVLVNILGEILRLHQGDLQAGGWRSRHLSGALVDLALNNPEEAVRQSAAVAAGAWENEATYQALLQALNAAGDTAAWKRAGFALARYCAAVEAPPPPGAALRESDGELRLVISLTPRAPRRPELYAPLAQAAIQATKEEQRAAAVEVATSEDSGKIALSNAVLDLVDGGGAGDALLVAEETIRQLPLFSSGYWWRGRALDALERNDEALADYTRVIELSPKFAEARLRRCILRSLAGDRQGALADLDSGAALDPDDGRIKEIRRWVMAQADQG